MPSTPDPAPLPQLGKSGRESTLSQPWMLTTRDGAFVSVQFKRTLAIECRIRLYSFRRALTDIVLISLVGGVTMGIVAEVIRAIFRGFQADLSLLTRLLVQFLAGGFILLILELIFIPVILGILMVFGGLFGDLFKTATVITLTPTEVGSRWESTGKTRNLRWTQLAGIEERLNGDICFVANFFGSSPIYVPHSSFPDRESAKRFYATAVALWKSNGNPNATIE